MLTPESLKKIDRELAKYPAEQFQSAIMAGLQILKANGVTLEGMADLRSNPAVRQQVMDVVRRATAAEREPAAAPAAAAPVVPPAPAPSTAQRLQEIETLRAMGTISEAEYTAKRAQIIAEL